MKKLDARGYRTMPWKNGGGTTTEVARWPEGGTLDDFEWRMSMASVGSDGPFSRFESVDRSIAVLSGAGMTLAFAGRGEVRLDCTSAPLAFPGDVAVSATLAAGTIEDFNVMTRRGRWRHLLTRVRIDAQGTRAPLGEWMLVLVAAGELHARSGGGTEALSVRDALLVEHGEVVALEPVGSAQVLVVDIWRG